MVLEIAHTVAIIMSTKDYLVFLRLHFSWKKIWSLLASHKGHCSCLISCLVYLVLYLYYLFKCTYDKLTFFKLLFLCGMMMILMMWCGHNPMIFPLAFTITEVEQECIKKIPYSIREDYGWLTMIRAVRLYAKLTHTEYRQELRNISTVGGRTTDKDNRREIQYISKNNVKTS